MANPPATTSWFGTGEPRGCACAAPKRSSRNRSNTAEPPHGFATLHHHATSIMMPRNDASPCCLAAFPHVAR
eukprot:9493354-Lingulodinium_polyedra.AAC.1